MNESSPILALNNNLMPEGWAESTLVDLASSRKGKKPRELSESAWENSVPYIDIAAFEQGKIRQYADRSSSVLVEPGDVLVVWDGARCGLAGKTPVLGALGSTLMHLKPHLIFPDYLVFLLQSCFEEINTNPRGSGITHVNPELFWELHLPIPPLEEQKRIVAKIEELLPLVNAVIERLNRASHIMKRFRQAVLSAACSGRLTEGWRETNPDTENVGRLFKLIKSKGFDTDKLLPELPTGWKWVVIDDLASDQPRSIQSGPFGSNLLHSEFQSIGVLAIGIDNVLDGHFSIGKGHRINQKKYAELRKYQARPMDVLITVMATIGRCCVIPENIEPAIITKHVYRITVNHDIIEPHYLMRAFQGSLIVQQQISDRTRGQTRPGINGAILKRIAIPTPPVLEQREIVHRVEALFALADVIEKHIEVARLRADKLTQSILAKAFRGELVPTEAELARQEGRSYEPAEVLLERIKNGRILALKNSRKSKAAL